MKKKIVSRGRARALSEEERKRIRDIRESIA